MDFLIKKTLSVLLLIVLAIFMWGIFWFIQGALYNHGVFDAFNFFRLTRAESHLILWPILFSSFALGVILLKWHERAFAYAVGVFVSSILLTFLFLIFGGIRDDAYIRFLVFVTSISAFSLHFGLKKWESEKPAGLAYPAKS